MYYPPNFVNQGPYYPPNPEILARYSEEQDLKFRANRIGFAVVMCFLLMNIISSLIVSLLMGLGLFDVTQINNGFQGIEPVAYYLMYGVYATVSVLIPFSVILKLCRVHIEEVFPFRPVKGTETASLVAVGLAVCMFANIATNLLSQNLQGFGITPSAPATPFENNPLSIALLLITTCVVPAFMEEFAYRGVILGLLRKFGDGFAIVCSAALFGLMHGNLVQIPFAFIVGLVLGYLVVHTGSMWPAILLHFCNNFYSCLLMILSSNLQAEVYNIISYASMLLIFVAGALAMVRLSRKQQNLFSLEPGDSVLTFRQRVAAFAGAPGVITALIILGLYTLLVMIVL